MILHARRTDLRTYLWMILNKRILDTGCSWRLTIEKKYGCQRWILKTFILSCPTVAPAHLIQLTNSTITPNKLCPQLQLVPLGSLLSVTASYKVHAEILSTQVRLEEKDEVRDRSSKVGMTCKFERYAEDFFDLGTSEKKLMKVYICVYNEFVRMGLPPRLSKCRGPKTVP